jgi:hypothetical protein
VPRELTQFKPGNPGGPGRPRHDTWLDILKRRLQDTQLLGEAVPNGMTNQEFLVDCCIKHAMGGNFQFLKEILDRTIGPVPKQEPEPELTAEAIAEMESVDARLDDQCEGEDAPEAPGQVPQ